MFRNSGFWQSKQLMDSLLLFDKYQGLGNDFVLLDKSRSNSFNTPDSNTIRKLCDRHYGVGADGVLIFNLIEENRRVEMVYYNADGSRAETCFNGLRCIAKHAVRTGKIPQDQRFIIMSDAGEINSTVRSEHNLVEIELAGPDFSACKIGLTDSKMLIEENIQYPSKGYVGTALSIGNPHFVAWKEGQDLSELNEEILKHGAEVENSSHFKNGVNFELASIIDETSIYMAVWERGVGQTFACGSGATATVCAGVKTGRLSPDVDILVKMLGGVLTIRVQKELERVSLNGEASHVFSGEINSDDILPS
ncbi:MAG: diaminopimelate epimerase [Calditrichaeota bacterium]|nr:diaminopimelate epimerase [Calditrichota bacterium]